MNTPDIIWEGQLTAEELEKAKEAIAKLKDRKGRLLWVDTK